MLADLGLARRVVLAPADVPLGSLGAVLAARDGQTGPVGRDDDRPAARSSRPDGVLPDGHRRRRTAA